MTSRQWSRDALVERVELMCRQSGDVVAKCSWKLDEWSRRGSAAPWHEDSGIRLRTQSELEAFRYFQPV